MLALVNSSKVYFSDSLFCFWNFLKAYTLGAYYLATEQYRRYTGKTKRLTRNDIPFRKQNITIITGGSRGIGLEVVNKLLSLGMQIVIGAPLNEEECLNVTNTFATKTVSTKVNVWPLDLSSMKSVKDFAKRFLQTNLPLHILINNAGIMYVPYEKTVDGFEKQFQVNYLGHCLLTKLLLPRLKATGSENLRSRIVNLCSSAHFVGNINFDDLQSEKCYSIYHGYLQSKLAFVLFTYALQRRLNNEQCHVTVNCVHPGVVYTNLYKHVWWAEYLGPYLFQSAKVGAETVVYAAVSPKVEGIGGKYLEECEIVCSSQKSLNWSLQEKMWEVTWDLLEPWTESNLIIEL